MSRPRVVEGVLPFEWGFDHLARAMPGLSLEPHQAQIVVLLAVLVALMLGRILSDVGFSKVDVALLFLAAPLLVAVNYDVWEASESASVAVNAAGFGIPVLLSLKFLVTGRAPWGATTFCVAVVTLVSYASSYAIPHEGVLIHYRVPALSAALVAVALRWGVWTEVGPVAYVGGALGVVIGADLFHLEALLQPVGVPHRIILGGAGVLDGIYLVGLLGVGLTTLAMAADHAIRAGMASEASEPPAPSAGSRAPGSSKGRSADS